MNFLDLMLVLSSIEKILLEMEVYRDKFRALKKHWLGLS